MEDFLDTLAVALFGITLADAHSLQVCISCKEDIDPEWMSEADLKEYSFSGLCPNCWDSETAD